MPNAFASLENLIQVKTRKCKMATSLYKAQDVIKTCEEHLHQELSCFCKTCRIFICTSCAKTTHHGHDWDLIALFAKERRTESPLLCRQIKAERLPKVREKVRSIDNNLSDIETQRDEDLTKLEERKTVLINMINSVAEKQKGIRNAVASRQSAHLEGRRHQLCKKMEYLEKMTTSLDTNVYAYNDYDLIEMERDMLKVLTEAESYEESTLKTSFTLGEINPEELEKMIIGEIEETETKKGSVNLIELKTFKQFQYPVPRIYPFSDTDAWVGDDEEDYVKKLSLSLIDMKEEIKTLPGEGFIPLCNGDFIISDDANQEIRRVTPNGAEIVIMKTAPLRPYMISKTHTDDIMVSLRETRFAEGIKPSHRRLVQRIALTGKVIDTYEFREDGITNLFTRVVRIVENGNSDICVINNTEGDVSELIVLFRDGRVKFTHHGQDENVPSTLMDVTCDEKYRLIVTDFTNGKLHLLSLDGDFLTNIMLEMPEKPLTATLYQNNLWVGFCDGTVKVYKYIS